ncbi:MAG: sel1 repeat family protein [Desulfobacteraceae bacterium]|nr:sel1 repeat family protein [Desulfobacteraceae bacterium]
MARTGKLDRELEHELICGTREFLEERDKSLIEELSQSDKELFEKSRVCLNDKKYQACLDWLLKVKNRETVCFDLGFIYVNLKEYEEAEKYYLMAAEKDSVAAMNNLGVLYEENFKDNAKAEEYYLMATEKGHVVAMNNLGLLYKDKLKDDTKAEKYYLMAAEKGYAGAIYNLGQLYRIKFKRL